MEYEEEMEDDAGLDQATENTEEDTNDSVPDTGDELTLDEEVESNEDKKFDEEESYTSSCDICLKLFKTSAVR